MSFNYNITLHCKLRTKPQHLKCGFFLHPTCSLKEKSLFKIVQSNDFKSNIVDLLQNSNVPLQPFRGSLLLEIKPFFRTIFIIQVIWQVEDACLWISENLENRLNKINDKCRTRFVTLSSESHGDVEVIAYERQYTDSNNFDAHFHLTLISPVPLNASDISNGFRTLYKKGKIVKKLIRRCRQNDEIVTTSQTIRFATRLLLDEKNDVILSVPPEKSDEASDFTFGSIWCYRDSKFNLNAYDIQELCDQYGSLVGKYNRILIEKCRKLLYDRLKCETHDQFLELEENSAKKNFYLHTDFCSCYPCYWIYMHSPR